MKLKKIIIAGAEKAFGIRMVKEASAPNGCTPDITGLFLQDVGQEWTLTEIDLWLWELIWIIPVKLVGDTCGLPVTWRSEYEDLPENTGWLPPVFYGEGVTGVVGYPLGWDSDRGPQYNYDWLRDVTVRIWAECNGTEYGPVTIVFRH